MNRIIQWLKTTIRPVARKVFGPLEIQFDSCLRSEIDGVCQSLLDVGCGFNSPVQLLEQRPARLVGVDAFSEVVEQSRAHGLHDEYHVMNVLDIAKRFPPQSFDCVLACDLVEHLNVEEAVDLIGQMERLARKKVIIFTPNGFLPQGVEYGNPLQRHLSGWTSKQMVARGYRVAGVRGLKCLRGEMAAIRWRPIGLWQKISLLSQIFTQRWPSLAFQLFCVKDIAGRNETQKYPL